MTCLVHKEILKELILNRSVEIQEMKKKKRLEAEEEYFQKREYSSLLKRIFLNQYWKLNLKRSKILAKDYGKDTVLKLECLYSAIGYSVTKTDYIQIDNEDINALGLVNTEVIKELQKKYEDSHGRKNNSGLGFFTQKR